MKKITLSAVNHPEFSKVIVKVASQTHKGVLFGGNVLGDNRKFRASNGLVIGSNSHPAKDADDKNTIWVQGTGPLAKQGTSIVVSRAIFDKLVVAVREYNLYFSDAAIFARQAAANRYAAPAPQRPAAPAGNCAYIVG